MINLQYIYSNEKNITCFDRYFSYLKIIEKEMSEPLAFFATDVRRYELNGAHTLHDAWLKSINVTKNYSENASPYSQVQICLLLATHTTEVNISYSNVTDMGCSLGSNKWPDQPVDLLLHEFTKDDDGVFQHVMQFDRGVWFFVKFTDFNFVESASVELKK